MSLTVFYFLIFYPVLYPLISRAPPPIPCIEDSSKSGGLQQGESANLHRPFSVLYNTSKQGTDSEG